MKLFRSKETPPNPNRISIPITGDELVILGRQAHVLNASEYEMLLASIAWYETELANAYKRLKPEELPVLIVPEGFQNMWPNNTTWTLTFKQDDIEQLLTLERMAQAEQLHSSELAHKALICNLHNLSAELIKLEDVAADRNENGFTRAEPKKPPLPDPRDIGF